MAKIGLPKGSGKQLKVREKSVKSQGILKWILSGNPVWSSTQHFDTYSIIEQQRLKQVCACAQTCQSLPCSHTHSMDTVEDSGAPKIRPSLTGYVGMGIY